MGASIGTLQEIERRVLWLAVRIIDLANRERPNVDGLKVGGHPASSASLTSVMTALYFGYLRAGDKVAVKPHASPVHHAIQYLLGNLDREKLGTLRQFGGLQAYPSRTKDPDPVDYSTGSVGLGAVAPLFGAAAERFLRARIGRSDELPPRFVALVGDAELDEGNVWEAISDPATSGLGNVMWVVDLNRQSLDRVVPGIRASHLMERFRGSGWHVVEAKYGLRLQELFRRPDGEVLRAHIDDMSNERYQSLFGFEGPQLRARFLEGADDRLAGLLADVPDDELGSVVRNLGGHDQAVLLDAFRQADEETDRPSVVFAYTVKGWGLPVAGDPLNHAAMLTGEQIDALRADNGLDLDTELDRFPPTSDAGTLVEHVAEQLRSAPQDGPELTSGLPEQLGQRIPDRTSTQVAFGRLLSRLKGVEGVGDRVVTTSPDVSISTNLGGWINKVGVYSPVERPEYHADGQLLRWREGPDGQHIELGISEMNLFMLLGALGLTHELHGRTLLPIGTVYDPFVLRGLDALIYGVYSGASFLFVGTPAGVSLAPEGGAHQSTLTPSVGAELPDLVSFEPAYAQAVDWILCDGISRMARRGGSTYLRLSTREIHQAPFTAAQQRLGAARLRSDVLAGGYRLLEPDRHPDVHLLASGPVLPEVLAAAESLRHEGVAATVIEVTSGDLLYDDWRRGLRTGVARSRRVSAGHHLARLIPPRQRRAPVVTVLDGASHSLAWVGSALGVRAVPLGVDEFGQSGTVPDLYRRYGLDPDSIVNAALIALDEEEA